MSTDEQPAGSLTVEHVAALAAANGLTIAPERLPAVAEQLNATRRAAELLLTLPDANVSGVVGPFDPTWPVAKRGAK